MNILDKKINVEINNIINNKIIVIDGYNLINMYFNKGHKIDKNFILDHKASFDGFYVFIKKLINYCKKNNFNIIVFFDGTQRFSEETKKKKENRIIKKIKEGQFGLIRYTKTLMSEFLKDYPIYHSLDADCDDILASFVKLHLNKFEKIIILSEDRDFIKYKWGDNKPDIVLFLSINDDNINLKYRKNIIWTNEKEINENLFKYKKNDSEYDLLPISNSELKDDEFISMFPMCHCSQLNYTHSLLKSIKEDFCLRILYSRNLIKEFEYNLEEYLFDLKIIRGILINHIFEKTPDNFNVIFYTYNNDKLESNILNISNFEYSNINEIKNKFKDDPLYFINNDNWKNKWLNIKKRIDNHYINIYQSKKAFNFEWYNIISTVIFYHSIIFGNNFVTELKNIIYKKVKCSDCGQGKFLYNPYFCIESSKCSNCFRRDNTKGKKIYKPRKRRFDDNYNSKKKKI